MRSIVIWAALAALFVPGALHAKTLPIRKTQHENMINRIRHEIRWHRNMTWRYQDAAHINRTHSVYSERRIKGIAYLRWEKNLWNKRRLQARRIARSILRLPPHAKGWECIHEREGSWTSQTGNGYYGGLQMTYGWMGLVQNAALLTAAAQMWAAETGYRQSGYSHSWLAGQWPNTYPPCSSYF